MTNLLAKLVVFVLLLAMAGPLGLATARAAIPGAKKARATEQTTRFDDVVVQGKYQASEEAVTTVESDKSMDALLAPPPDFKDRLKRSAAAER